MAEETRPPEPDASMAAALDDAAATLLSVWEEARERTTSRLSVAQLRAVMVVEQHDGINLRRLATLLGTLLPSASRLCDRLVAAGMLEREPGRYDRREISLHLTPEATRLLTELRAARQARLAEVLAGMSPAGREALRHGLAEFQEVARRSAPADQSPADQSPADQSPAPATFDDPRCGAGQHSAVPAARCPASGPGARPLVAVPPSAPPTARPA